MLVMTFSKYKKHYKKKRFSLTVFIVKIRRICQGTSLLVYVIYANIKKSFNLL